MGRGMGRVGRFLMTAAVPSFLTFLIAGIWHGSGWTFVVYGAWHGIAIATYLAWREFGGIKLPSPAAWAITMVTVICGLVIFRAPDMTTALSILGQMWGFASTSIDAAFVTIDQAQAVSLIVILSAITLLLPNTQQILHLDWPVIDSKPDDAALNAGLVTWHQTYQSVFVTACIFTVGITSIGSSTGFLYYKF